MTQKNAKQEKMHTEDRVRQRKIEKRKAVKNIRYT